MRKLLESPLSWLPPFPLGLTLSLAVLLPFVLAMALTGWYSTRLLEEHTRSRMQEDIELIARTLRLPVSHALEQGYERTIERALESAFSIGRVYGVYVYDSDGETVYASGARAASMASQRAAAIAEQGERQGEFDRAGTEQVFSYFVPLIDAGERINGLLQITRRGSDFDEYIGRVRNQSFAVIAASAVMLSLIILVGHRWSLGRHLRAVEAGVSRVTTEDLGHRLELSGPRELQRIQAAVNAMLDAIERSRQALSAQKDREAELTAKLYQSEKLAAIGQLAAGVAHELGSPLSTIDGKAQQALRRDTLPEPIAAALGRIRREASRMERIIRQLLDFGRANPLDRRPVRADTPLASVLKRAEIPAHLTLERRIAPEAAEHSVAVDLLRLEQALANLLHNALQAARARVRVSCRLAPGEIRYCIEDDGDGVPEAIRAHMFEPFFTTKRTGQGTGLGLAVAHSAAREHGGNIEVGQAAMGGARFSLTLPIAGESSDE